MCIGANAPIQALDLIGQDLRQFDIRLGQSPEADKIFGFLLSMSTEGGTLAVEAFNRCDASTDVVAEGVSYEKQVPGGTATIPVTPTTPGTNPGLASASSPNIQTAVSTSTAAPETGFGTRLGAKATYLCYTLLYKKLLLGINGSETRFPRGVLLGEDLPVVGGFELGAWIGAKLMVDYIRSQHKRTVNHWPSSLQGQNRKAKPLRIFVGGPSIDAEAVCSFAAADEEPPNFDGTHHDAS